jgi:glucosamine--fructose-6-phosphate aminotransferase (isomerizing)
MPSIHGIHTYQEIMSQGEVWNKVIEKAGDQLISIGDWLARKHDEVVFIGCGSTYYLSLSAAKIWTKITKEASRGIPSSEIWYYGDANLSRQKPLLVAVSRSGETTETLNAIKQYQQLYGDGVLIISCYPDSSLSKNASHKLLAPDAQETSVAQTRSFSSMFILSQMLAGYAVDNQSHLDDLKQLPAIFSRTIEKYEPMIERIGSDPKYLNFVFLGSGVNYGIANEVMLKMKEMSTSVSEAFHFMEFRHGPMSMITDRSLVIGIVSESRKAEELKVLQEMKGLGATTVALVNHAPVGTADHIIAFDASISEIALNVMILPVLQLLGYYHSLSKGLNPDQPTNLNYVVYL